jgi:hypothetical protein
MLTNTKLTDILTPAGKRTLVYFTISRRIQDPRIKDLTPPELNGLNRFVRYQSLVPALNYIVRHNIVRNVMEEDMYPIGSKIYDVTQLTSKSIRKANEEVENTICIYKAGLIMNPIEVSSWMSKVKRLTSVRHRSNILRVAHGEIYSNERLFRFGLIPTPDCNNCQEPVESISHKLIDCPAAKKVWKKIKELKSILNLEMVHPVTIEEALGCNIRDKTSLAINAETITRILGQGGKKYSPEILTTTIVKTISLFEPLNRETKVKLDNYIRGTHNAVE